MRWQDVPCKLWTGATNGTMGYPHVRINGKDYNLHRLVWVEHNGPIEPGLCVLHHCDNPLCYEIAHLFKGTKKDNAQDRKRKGRSAPKTGILNGRARFTEDDIRTIRSRYLAGELQRVIAEDYGTSQGRISSIVRQETWVGVS